MAEQPFSGKRAALALLGAALAVMSFIGVLGPMGLIFPLWIFTALFRRPLARAFGVWPGSTGFLAAAIIYGMAVEALAVWTNLARPPAERVLLDPSPGRDLLLGFFYYAFVAVCWYVLLRRIRFSEAGVFFVTGVYGIVMEESGRVVLRAIAHPLTGTLYALLVMCVYGLFPMLALKVTQERFPLRREPPSAGKYALALLALFAQAALYGNTVYPLLKAWFAASGG